MHCPFNSLENQKLNLEQNFQDRSIFFRRIIPEWTDFFWKNWFQNKIFSEQNFHDSYNIKKFKHSKEQIEVKLHDFKILLNNEIFVCQPASLPKGYDTFGNLIHVPINHEKPQKKSTEIRNHSCFRNHIWIVELYIKYVKYILNTTNNYKNINEHHLCEHVSTYGIWRITRIQFICISSYFICISRNLDGKCVCKKGICKALRSIWVGKGDTLFIITKM